MAARASFALVGPFDIDDFGVQLAWRVALAELARRRPDIAIRSFAPFGSTRPLAVAADVPAEPLLPRGAARTATLGADLSAAIRVPGRLALDELRAHYDAPPAPSDGEVADAALVLADPALGVPTATLPDEPDPGNAAARLWPAAVCEQRREFLRAMHWWPQDGAPIVVQGSTDDDAAGIDALAAALPTADAVVALEGSARDREFAAALEARLGSRVTRLPAVRSIIEDRVAAIAGAARVVASDPSVRAAAASYARPHHTLSEAIDRRAPAAAANSDVVEALDATFDRLAALDGGAPRSVTTPDEILALRRAITELEARLAQERVVLADYVRAVRTNTRAEVEALEAELQQRLTARIRRRLRPGE